jgi:hypothetical protein
VIVDLSEEDERELNIRLNANTGEWDWGDLQMNWDLDELKGWGLEVPINPDILTKKEISDQEFENEINKYNNNNCELPIVPVFHEKYSYFIILCENEIDEQFIRNTFNLNKKTTSHKKTDDRLSNIISVEKIQEICLK